MIAKHFQKIFTQCLDNPDIWIIKFKAGIDSHYSESDENYKLVWNKEDIKKGYKEVYVGKKYLYEALLDNVPVKIDLIAKINDVFTELSEVYFININNHLNLTTDEKTTELVGTELQEEFDKLVKDGSYYKALKRAFSMYKLHPRKHKAIICQLVQLFNSEAGIINLQKNRCSLILDLLDQKFRKVEMKDIYDNLQFIKQQLSYVSQIKLKNTIPKIIDTMCDGKIDLYESCTQLVNYLEKVVNEVGYTFYRKNIKT